MIFVASLIFASMILFQGLLDSQENDGSTVNIAGRQRMLSQKITKTCLLIATNKDNERKTKFFEILKEDLRNFKTVQNKLTLLNNSPKITSLYNSCQKSYQKIITNASKIMEVDDYQKQEYLLVILENEQYYLKDMITIVDEYTSQSHDKITYFKKLFIFVDSTIILFLLFIVLFIISPLIKGKELNEIKLKNALLKEKELGELKMKFVAIASHEFRTPLSAINFAAGYIKRYGDKITPSVIKKKLHKIEDQVLHMTQLLDDMLIVGQAEAGKMRNNPVSINLGNFIYDIIEEVASSSKESHEIELIDIENLKSGGIFIDEKLGRNIFVNLLSNALKFSQEAKKVVVELSSEEKYTVISITDFGIGIPKSEFKSIFIPFNRGKNVDFIQGTGLGLSIAKDAVDLMGGKIIVNSTLGNGTTFIVKIPKK